MISPRASLSVCLLSNLAAAIPWAGPAPTPAGLMAMAGMSPRPTDAPGPKGIPQELQRRNLPFPPPENWCGFISGDSNAVLSCKSPYACAVSGSAVGCCPATYGACDALYTTCYNYNDYCDASCLLDVSIGRCSDPLRPYCVTYAFAGGTSFHLCETSTMAPVSVEFLFDYYITAISSSAPSLFAGASLAPESSHLSSASSIHFSTPTSLSFSTPTPVSYYTGFSSPSSSSSNTYTYHSSGISSAAVSGIASGVSVSVAVVAGLLVFFCLRRRRRMRVAQSQAIARANFPNQPQPPPVQQVQVYPKTAEGETYQPVSQQAPQYPDSQFGAPAPQYPAEQAGFYTPKPAQPQDTQTPTPESRPFSAATSTLVPHNASEVDAHTGDYYGNPPVSPTITEADGRFPSPMHTGSTPTPAPPLPPPAGNAHGPVYEAPPSAGTTHGYEAPPPGGQGPVYEAPPPSGYEAPPPVGSGQGPVYEVGNTPQYQGPWELGQQR